MVFHLAVALAKCGDEMPQDMTSLFAGHIEGLATWARGSGHSLQGYSTGFGEDKPFLLTSSHVPGPSFGVLHVAVAPASQLSQVSDTVEMPSSKDTGYTNAGLDVPGTQSLVGWPL